MGRSLGRREMEGRFSTLTLDPSVKVIGAHAFEVGHDVEIQANVVINCGDGNWSSDGGFSCGDRCYVGPGTVIFAGGGVEFGDDVLIGPGVLIASHQQSFGRAAGPYADQPMKYRPVRLGSNVAINSGAIILPGVSIGAGAVVAAGSVVTRDVEPGAVVRGTAARELGRPARESP